MTCAALYELISDPDKLSEKTLPELKQIVNDFPYFHAARMLYLKNLALLEDIRLNVELKKMAVFLPDRVKLFVLLNGEQRNESLTEFAREEVPTEKQDKFSLVETFLAETNSTDFSKTNEPDAYITPVSGDYIQWLLHNDPQKEIIDTRMEHQELIDSFIESGSENFGKRLKINEEEENLTEQKGPLNSENIALDSSYFTETLAHVYIKQKRYDKALEIIKNLSLKYPEKNIYFADQIRFLEKLIIHTKK